MKAFRYHITGWVLFLVLCVFGLGTGVALNTNAPIKTDLPGRALSVNVDFDLDNSGYDAVNNHLLMAAMTASDPVARNSDVVSLLYHIRELLAELDKRYQQRFQSQDEVVKSSYSTVQLAIDKVEVQLIELDKRYQQRFTAQDEAVKAALTSAQLAVDKSEVNANKWRENANEWRAAMGDKDKTLATKEDTGKIQKDIEELKTYRDIAIGKASQSSVTVVYALSILSLCIGLIQLFRGKYNGDSKSMKGG